MRPPGNLGRQADSQTWKLLEEDDPKLVANVARQGRKRRKDAAKDKKALELSNQEWAKKAKQRFDKIAPTSETIDFSEPCPFLTFGTDQTTFVLAACSKSHATSLTYLSLRVRGLSREQILRIPFPWLPRPPPSSLEQSRITRAVSTSGARSSGS